MPRTADIALTPDQFSDEAALKLAAAKAVQVAAKAIQRVVVLRRSIDARGQQVKYRLKVEVWMNDEAWSPNAWHGPDFQPVAGAPEVAVVGAGPAGLFAALRLIELGLKPIVLERGKDVRARRRDLAAINRDGEVNPESNYCFGEGGAGTYSDGKLYTRSTKRGDTQRILDRLVYYGAPGDILVDAHPHIGTNKLPGIIEAIREAIIAAGGEVRFGAKVTDIAQSFGAVHTLTLESGETIRPKGVILATGHSARDIYTLLHARGILIEAKPFALGVRVEHPQTLIDRIQYHCPTERHPNLPAASYALVRQVHERGVYSFCMCPGGIICPASTEPGNLVVNGWSPSKRNNPHANSGMVVELSLSDFDGSDPLAAMRFQAEVEAAAWQAGGGKLVAPAQGLEDFVRKRTSAKLPDCSYLPGITSVDMRAVLPAFIADRLREGLAHFGKAMRGYVSNDAVMVGVESRTSSPVRIPRDAQTLMHPQVAGLFPCAEGAGYAGGIMSAAIDGEKCADAVAAWVNALKN